MCIIIISLPSGRDGYELGEVSLVEVWCGEEVLVEPGLQVGVDHGAPCQVGCPEAVAAQGHHRVVARRQYCQVELTGRPWGTR